MAVVFAGCKKLHEKGEKVHKIDVEKIMEEIRQEIQDRHYSEKDLNFVSALHKNEKFSWKLYNETCGYLKRNCRNPVYFPLEGNSFKVLVQKVIRRTLRFVNYCAFQYQNQLNEAVSVCLEETGKNMKELEHKNRMLQKQIHMLGQEMDTLRKKDS